MRVPLPAAKMTTIGSKSGRLEESTELGPRESGAGESAAGELEVEVILFRGENRKRDGPPIVTFRGESGKAVCRRSSGKGGEISRVCPAIANSAVVVPRESDRKKPSGRDLNERERSGALKLGG